MTIRKTLTALLLTTLISLTAACDSAEERAEKRFQSGMALLQAGDVDRALVEFRNVFQLNGRHREARIAYAEAERKRGNLREAYGQLLRLVEQYPDDMDGLRSLAEIATQSGEWDEADRHITAGLAIQADDPRLLAARVAADYGRAATDGDEVKLADAAKRAGELVKTTPDSMLLFGILIDSSLRAQDYPAAIKAIDAALVLTPDDTTLYAARISTLAAMGDDAGVEAGLKDMVARFPDDQGISDGLVRWYVSRDNLDAAEDYLRKRIDPASADVIPTLVLIRFLSDKRSPEIAVAELDKIIAANPNPVYRSARAGLQFDLGQRDQAITEMTDILKDAPATDDTRKIKVGLAQMQVAVGNQIAARALVEEILAADEGNVEAMKLKASWLILGDEVGDAVTVLRKALDQNRRDPSVMTLLAQAYERDGNRDLMREMLSMAVDASNNAPDESLRYAQFLMSEDQATTAEAVLIDALRLAPGSPMLLGPLGQVYIQMKDWPRAQAVAAELEALATPETTTAATGLRAAIFAGQQQNDEAIGYLQGLVDGGQGGLAPKIAIIRTHLAEGQNAEATAYSAKMLAENPKDPSLRFIDASVKSATGDAAGAEAVYRDLVAEDASRSQVWMALFRSIASDPARADQAGPVLDAALTALPQSAELKWAKAGYLERNGDIDGALAVYEALYAEDSMNMIVANNLASLLSTHRTDPESLERAEKIARRLRGSEVGAYQDTYGWIAYRRGNFDEALPELEKAAASLPDDPQAQYHLAMAYLALQRNVEALTFFTKAQGLVTAGDKRPFVAETLTEIDKLAAKGVTINN
jgi:cellulose synthase operon protein C